MKRTGGPGNLVTQLVAFLELPPPQCVSTVNLRRSKKERPDWSIIVIYLFIFFNKKRERERERECGCVLKVSVQNPGVGSRGFVDRSSRYWELPNIFPYSTSCGQVFILFPGVKKRDDAA